MLGKLTRWLRLMGFSVEYATPDKKDTEILSYCRQNSLILLTRDRELSQRYKDSLYIKSDDYRDQIKVFIGNHEPSEELFFSRCPLCNSELEIIPMEIFKGDVPDGIREKYTRVFHCSNCGKVYWEGSHFDSIRKTLKDIISETVP